MNGKRVICPPIRHDQVAVVLQAVADIEEWEGSGEPKDSIKQYEDGAWWSYFEVHPNVMLPEPSDVLMEKIENIRNGVFI